MEMMHKFGNKWKIHRWWDWDSNPGGSMEGTDEYTELLRHPKNIEYSLSQLKLLIVRDWFNFSQKMIFSLKLLNLNGR